MSKLALHIQAWMPAALDSVLYVNAPLLKVMAPDYDPIKAVIDARPDVTLVLRRYFNDGEQRELLDAGVDGGALCADLVAEQYARVIELALARGVRIYAESLNEIGLWNDAPSYCEHTAGFAQSCPQYGLLPLVYNFATGNPPGYETEAGLDLESYWAHYYDGLRAAKAAGGALGLHEYSAPRMQDQESWLCLRYRRVYAFLPEDCRLPLIITECGIDGGVIGAPSAAAAGWTNYASADEYAAQLRWYDGELSKDPYVIGATVFLAGNADMWGSFDVTGVGPVLDAIKEGGGTAMPKPTTITALNVPVGPPGGTALFRFRADGIDGWFTGFADVSYPLIPGNPNQSRYGPNETKELPQMSGGEHEVTVEIGPNTEPLPGAVTGEIKLKILEMDGTTAGVDAGDHGPFPITIDPAAAGNGGDPGEGYASADERAALDELWALAGGYRAQTPPDVTNADYIEQRVIRIKQAHGQ